jgi:hypothetical protein
MDLNAKLIHKAWLCKEVNGSAATLSEQLAVNVTIECHLRTQRVADFSALHAKTPRVFPSLPLKTVRWPRSNSYFILQGFLKEMLELLVIIAMTLSETSTETFTIGYLTGSQRRPGDLEYPRPGLTISGAISLAVDEVNRDILGERGHRLDFIVAETYGEEVISVQKTADLWTKNVSVYVGPQETCEHEAFMAAAFNLPMISYVSKKNYDYK